MIERTQLRTLAEGSLIDAKVLIDNTRWNGAYYLCGYAIEFALKERIGRALNWEGYPDNNSEFQGYASFRTHDLDILLHLSGVESAIRQQFRGVWYAVRDWKPEFRYRASGESAESDATQMLENSRILLEALWTAVP